MLWSGTELQRNCQDKECIESTAMVHPMTGGRNIYSKHTVWGRRWYVSNQFCLFEMDLQFGHTNDVDSFLCSLVLLMGCTFCGVQKFLDSGR